MIVGYKPKHTAGSRKKERQAFAKAIRLAHEKRIADSIERKAEESKKEEVQDDTSSN